MITDSTNPFNNLKCAVIENGIVLNIILIGQDNFESFTDEFKKENQNLDIIVIPEGVIVGANYTYENGKFIPNKPFKAWVLNEEFLRWDPPTPKPEGNYCWSDDTDQWILQEE